MKRFNTSAWIMASFIAGMVFVNSCGSGGGGGGGNSANGAVSDADFAALQADVLALQTLLAAVTDDGTTFTISGRNVQITSGSGSTNDGGTLTGLGNLIIGYNADVSDTKDGSHNLILGDNHSYTSYGGLVAGFDNSITEPSASVSGGYSNSASGTYSSVSGGGNNVASGQSSSISGGHLNSVNALYSSISGGSYNIVNGVRASISGGRGCSDGGLENRWYVGDSTATPGCPTTN